MNTHPFDHKDTPKPDHCIWHEACQRIAVRYNVKDLWLARRKVQQAVRKVYDSYKATRSVVATREALEGIERHREIL